jgi:hypothetical protein
MYYSINTECIPLCTDFQALVANGLGWVGLRAILVEDEKPLLCWILNPSLFSVPLLIKLSWLLKIYFSFNNVTQRQKDTFYTSLAP